MKANRQMLALAAKIGAVDPSVVPQELIQTTPETPPLEEKKPEDEKKKPSEPEEEEGGLGDLFG